MKACCFAPGLLVVLLQWIATPQSAFPADVSVYGVVKSQQFIQTNAGPPVAVPSNGFAFATFVVASADQVVTDATVKPANRTPLRQLHSEGDEVIWQFEERFNGQAEMNRVYPNGTIFSPFQYQVTIRTVHDGTKTPSLSLGAASVVGSPPTLQVTNFDSAQAIHSEAPFTLRWNTSGGQSIDRVQLQVFNSASNIVFASPEPFAPGALTGQSNAVLIHAVTLPPVANLAGRLTILRPLGLDMNSYPGATGVPALVKVIEFPMATSTSTTGPRLEVVSANSNPFQLRYVGEPNQTYQIQISDNLKSWTTQFVTNSSTGTGTYTDPSSAEAKIRFYRILVEQ